ncbi:GNAT family N-acetyltransferase [Vibrio sp. TBV020]|uniref:GNAT family N-acetyltransferase n=1 Tax=Vibrio sp. TBV020 TaxID=3137398 RepID=UPI0038CDA9AB
MFSKKDFADIKLELLSLSEAEQLLQFELENKLWFEQFIPPRDNSFYSIEGVRAHIQEFLLEHKCEQLLPLVIKTATGSIAGRINFTNVNRTKGTAHVGYRVGKAFTSKGLAKTALSCGLSVLQGKGIHRVFAYAEVSNIASQKVLTSNGFTKVRIVENYAKLNGSSIDCIEFTCMLNG